jgi:hypothetical protein
MLRRRQAKKTRRTPSGFFVTLALLDAFADRTGFATVAGFSAALRACFDTGFDFHIVLS